MAVKRPLVISSGTPREIAAGDTLPFAVRIPVAVALTDGATIAVDASLGELFRCTLAGDRTILAPSNPTDGQYIELELTASGANRTPTLTTGAAGFIFGSDITGLTAIVSGTTDFIRAQYNSTANRWRVKGYIKGF